jgi:hypothetical protein
VLLLLTAWTIETHKLSQVIAFDFFIKEFSLGDLYSSAMLLSNNPAAKMIKTDDAFNAFGFRS